VLYSSVVSIKEYKLCSSVIELHPLVITKECVLVLVVFRDYIRSCHSQSFLAFDHKTSKHIGDVRKILRVESHYHIILNREIGDMDHTR
jgi:hypothetical protein